MEATYLAEPGVCVSRAEVKAPVSVTVDRPSCGNDAAAPMTDRDDAAMKMRLKGDLVVVGPASSDSASLSADSTNKGQQLTVCTTGMELFFNYFLFSVSRSLLVYTSFSVHHFCGRPL